MNISNKYNTVKVASCNDDHKDEAVAQLFERSLLFNRSDDTLGIVISKDDEKQCIPISAIADNVNIEKRDGVITLVENPVVESITTQADGNGIDWKSQSKFAETTTDRTIILLFKQDTTQSSGIGVFGGEVLEKGDSVYSHYQVSMTSTGSRLMKGSSTNSKKAKPCLAKLGGVYYYGIHFKNSSPAGIYFAGWSKIPEGLVAPDYTTYTDGDMSEIIDLDDDSDTGTQVINYEFLTYDDITWEFFTAPYIKVSTSTENTYYLRNSYMVYTTDFNGTGGAHFANGYYHSQNRYYLHFYTDINYTYNGETWSTSHAILLTNNYLYASSSGVVGYCYVPGGSSSTGEISFYVRNAGNKERTIRLRSIDPDTRFVNEEIASVTVPAYATQTVTFKDVPGGEYYFYQSGAFYYYNVTISYSTESITIRDENWNVDGSNNGYSLTNGLRITSDAVTTWSEDTAGNNAGYIDFESASGHSNPAMTLRVLGACTLTVGFLAKSSNTTNIRISETLDTSSGKWSDSVSVDSSSTTTITECTYSYTGEDAVDLYIMNETNPVRISYVKIDYPDAADNSDNIADIIQSLPTTGEDGSPHIIRLSGTITRLMLLKVAATLREDSNKQVVLDCSEGLMEEDYLDWRSDTTKESITYKGITYSMCLNSCFSNCVSLREFYYPHNVTSTGSDTFRNCSFLRKVRLNDEITAIGDNQSQWSANNNSLFAGARLKTIFIPKSVSSFSGYCFSYSNIINVYFAEESAFISAATSSYGNWCSFPSVKEQLRFKCPADLYTVWSAMNGTWNSYGNGGLGADGDGVQYISSSCIWSDHVELWEGEEEDINYTE